MNSAGMPAWKKSRYLRLDDGLAGSHFQMKILAFFLGIANIVMA